MPTPQPAPLADTRQNVPAVLSTEWMQEQIPHWLLRAVDEPTDENVRAIAYLHHMASNRASQFAAKWEEVFATDPFLDVTNSIPTATAARNVYTRHRGEMRREVLRALSERMGIWFFFDAECEWCFHQAQAIEGVVKRNGFETLNISLDGNEIPNLVGPVVVNDGHARALKIERVPSTVLLAPPDQFIVVSQGMIGGRMLEERIIISARRMGVLDDELEQKLNPNIVRERAENQLRLVEEMDSDQPYTWINALREASGYEPIGISGGASTVTRIEDKQDVE